MLRSMTGFGKSEVLFNDKKISIEIKSLNSKQMDINTRIPNSYLEKEIEIRSDITQELQRGKVYAQISVENIGSSPSVEINKDLALSYFAELKTIAAITGQQEPDYLSLIMRMPDVVKSQNNEVDEEEWSQIKSGLKVALADLDKFRIEEGATLELDFKMRINLILDLLKQVEPFEKMRVTNLREKLLTDMQAFSDKLNIDKNRFEQELIFYMEKLDITEEKVRLKKHCDYFMGTLKADELSKGRKLGFILQEIGREINTLGSKANDAEIQKLVVQMKDELEKIKEQSLNIL